MSAGVNYVGGRGRIAPRQAKNVERLPKEHFAKQRFIDYTQTAQGEHNAPDSKPVFTMTFKHAHGNATEHTKATPSTTASHSSASFGPNVIDKPCKPTKQSKLLEMMDSSIRQNESFDVSRSRVGTTDLSRYLGLDIFSRKRKLGQEINNGPQKRPFSASNRAFGYSKDAAPRAFVCSPVKEITTTTPIQRGDSEEILSFGTPSISNETPASSRSSSPATLLVTPQTSETSSEVSPDVKLPKSYPPKQLSSPNIPPNLWENAYFQAARTMKISNAVPLDDPPTPKGVSAGTSVDTWIALNGYLPPGSDADDETICAFNLLAPGPRSPVTEPENMAYQTHFSDPLDSNDQFECNLPVIVPAPLQGVPAATNMETEPRTPQIDQASEFDNRVGHGARTFPFLPRPIRRSPVIQHMSFHSPSLWLESTNGNIAADIVLPQVPVPWDRSSTTLQGKDQANGAVRYLGWNSWNAKETSTEPPSSQSSVDSMQSSQVPMGSFSLFDDDLDGGSDS